MWMESRFIKVIIILSQAWDSFGQGDWRNPLESFHCDFEESDCGITWITEDAYDTWIRASRAACCDVPRFDVTTASRDGHFMYLKEDDALANEGKIYSAKSVTPWIGGGGENYCISFYYYMHGITNQVNLTVHALMADQPPYVLLDDTGFTSVFGVIDSNYFVKFWKNWPPIGMDIRNTTPFQMLFEGRIDGDTTVLRNIIAVDEISVTGGLCSSELFSDFDDGHCGYYVETKATYVWDYFRTSNDHFPQVDHSDSGTGGRFSFDCTMRTFGGSGYVTSLPYAINDTNTGHLHIFPDDLPWCLQFWMAANEDNEALLEMFAITDEKSVLLWTHEGSTPQHQSDPYTSFEIPIPRGVYQIQFKATCPNYQYTVSKRMLLAIDEIAIAEKDCTAKLPVTTSIPPTTEDAVETTTEQRPTTTGKIRPFLNFFPGSCARREDFWDSYTIAALCVLVLAERFIWKGVLVA